MNEVRVKAMSWRLAIDAQHVLDIGKRHGYTFLAHPNNGMIEKPKAGIGWVYVPYGSDATEIPEEGLKRLRILRDEGIRASQVIIGHELEVADEADEKQHGLDGRPRLSPLAVAGIVAGIALGAAVVGTLAAPVAVPAATAATVAVPSLTTLGTVGLLSGALLLDPSLVVVLEGTGQWVQVYSWVEV